MTATKIVLDTNIVISCALKPESNLSQIWDMIVAEKLQIYYNADILAEYVSILSRPKFDFDFMLQNSYTDFVKENGIIFDPITSTTKLLDEKDRIFYDTATQCGATLITGNIKHYPIKPYIKTPADFLRQTHHNTKPPTEYGY